jgi:hypothetical protein
MAGFWLLLLWFPPGTWPQGGQTTAQPDPASRSWIAGLCAFAVTPGRPSSTLLGRCEGGGEPVKG